MITVKDIIQHIDFDTVEKEIKIHHGDDHLEELNHLYLKLCNMPCKKNENNMVIFIRVLKENEQGDEDITIQDFDNNDSTLMFDVCGKDDLYDGLYSIASAKYDELLGFYIESSTIERFSYSQILAHILWEIEWNENT
ncbi:MAG: DUF6557 family protein [Clostridiaceae bacterium]